MAALVEHCLCSSFCCFTPSQTEVPFLHRQENVLVLIVFYFLWLRSCLFVDLVDDTEQLCLCLRAGMMLSACVNW